MSIDLFTGRAEDYEKARPSCAIEAIDYICSIIPSNAVIADIGAGTGKFTLLMAERGYKTYAIEPNSDMREKLAVSLRAFENVQIINATAEFTKLPPSSVDMVAVVTALHWFDLEAFRRECKRILKPNGQVIVIYNSREYKIKDKSSHPNKTATEIFFGEFETLEFSNHLYYSREEYISYFMSHSNVPKPTDENYETYLNELNSQFDKESVNGLYLFDFITLIYLKKSHTKQNAI